MIEAVQVKPESDISVEREIMRLVLERAEQYPWTLQGFGMFRLYLGNAGRIHLWDRRFAMPDVSDIHDHFWNFSSLVIVGQLQNVRFLVREGECEYTHYKQTLVTGEGGGLIGKPEPVRLLAQEVENYFPGDSYTQNAHEVHQSLPELGTVTFMRRSKGGAGETARVFWPLRKKWVTAEPRPARVDEICEAARLSLKKWF